MRSAHRVFAAHGRSGFGKAVAVLPCGAGVAWALHSSTGSSFAEDKAWASTASKALTIFSRTPVACEARPAEPFADTKERPVLRTIPLEEVRNHCTADDCWITYNGEVYDVSSLVSWHPGGKEALLGAGGLDITAFWEKYTIHYKSSKATDRLTACKIGVLSEADVQRAESFEDPETGGALRDNTFLTTDPTPPKPASDSVARAQARSSVKTSNLVKIVAMAPILNLTRHFLKYLGLVCPPLARWIAGLLPVGVHGVGPTAQLDKSKKPRIAVVGGGIAGCGCAWMLVKSGFEVTLYEPREILGGNAQFHSYHHNGKTLTQDLTVLFWAKEFYKNYTCLLNNLDVTPAVIQATYSIKTNRWGRDEWFTPPGNPAEKVLVPSIKDRFPEDFEKFDKMVRFVNNLDDFFTMDSRPSFYKHVGIFSYFNPLNYITLRRLCTYYGISDEWYEGFLRPFHGWNFSSVLIDDLPAIAIGALDSLVPMNRTRNHESWGPKNSKEVFDKLAVGIDVKLNTRVESVREVPEGLCLKTEYGKELIYDRVVMACPAGAAANVIGGNWFERSLLDGVLYQDDFGRNDWKDWIENPVHTDTAVIPGTPEQKEALMQHLSFIVDVDAEQKHAEYTHILGSWSPSAVSQGEKGAPMFLTQSVFPNRPIDASKVEWHTSAPRAHPALCMHNLLITQMLSLVQGRRGIYYCSNWSTGGNGHDLSFLSGLCVAGAMGADYPFLHDPMATLDYQQKREFMGLPSAPNAVSYASYWPVAALAMAFGCYGGLNYSS